jgi:hypothetical protein
MTIFLRAWPGMNGDSFPRSLSSTTKILELDSLEIQREFSTSRRVKESAEGLRPDLRQE